MPITPVSLLLPNLPAGERTTAAELGESFAQLLREQVHRLNALQQRADVMAQSYIVDKSVNVHQVMLALEEASLSLQLAVQVRNKVVEAYQEIARMQL
ncbi:MAG TPA: flagellar hook-basal body complex protein FliE [Firmicutes bacterium]|jgi:flagellar hook-basal body complex protein FliE|nr:flagellar hook-basal body complex protein FliE [Bacillota bacterium]